MTLTDDLFLNRRLTIKVKIAKIYVEKLKVFAFAIGSGNDYVKADLCKWESLNNAAQLIVDYETLEAIEKEFAIAQK